MIRRLSFAGSLLALAASSGAARAAETAPDPAALRPLLDRFCVDCHGEFYAENEFRLDADALPLGGKLDADALAALVRVHDRLKSGEMPPEEADAPDGTLRAHSVAALAGMLHEADRKRQCEEGRTRLRRMTRGEYEHAVHDLLHVDASLKYVLPGDAVAHGFDRTVDALGTSSVLVDGYLEAAEVAVEAAAVLGPKPERTTERHDYLTHERYAGLRKSESKITHVLPDALAFYASNYTPTELRSYKCEVPGRYRVRVSAYAYNHDPAQAEPVVYSAYAGWFAGPSPTKSLVGQFAAPPKPPAAPADWAPAPAEFTLSLEEGQSFKFAPYDIGHRIWSDTAARSGETALALRWIEIEGPIVDEWPPPRYRALFGNLPTVLTNAEAVAANPRTERRYEVVSEDPGRDVRRSLVALATRAFRRPLRQGELNELAELLDERLAAGEPFAEVVKLGAKAILCDPAFLTIGGESEREEASPSRTHASGLAGEGEPSPEPLGPHALASRLSFMLWGSIPDEELRLHADAGTIADPALFREQAARLLADPKHERFTADFLDQWLDLAWIDASTPDPGLAPEYDDALRPAMIEETRRTFEHMLTHDRPVREVADADWAILNARLARHYGLDPDELGLPPAGYERVTLPADGPGSVRGGFLTQASVAKVTANGTHTSPVLRGQFVMDAILGQPIPPPPPNVPAVEPDVRGAETIREKLAAHRADPACATCHRKMDPAGFALESLDVIGTFRDRYRVPSGDGERVSARVGNRKIQYAVGLPVNPADVLPDGRAFADLREFKALLAADDRQLARSLVEKWLIYGTGEGCGFADRRAVDAILDAARRSGDAAHAYGLRTLLLETLCSGAFKRR